MKRVVKGSARTLSKKPRPAEARRARLPAPGGGKLVWRISAEHPEGAWVDPARLPPTTSTVAPSEPSRDTWATSTMDLLDGVEIVEGAEDTIPAELLEELFETKPKPPAK